VPGPRETNGGRGVHSRGRLGGAVEGARPLFGRGGSLIELTIKAARSLGASTARTPPSRRGE